MSEETKKQAIYEQNCEDFRSLNRIMWGVPILAMTLTGGLGAAIGTFDLSSPARSALLGFAGLANFILIVVLFRLRSIMDRLLGVIHVYQGTQHKKGFFVVKMFSIILLVGGVGCVAVAVWVDEVFPPTSKGTLVCAHGIANIRVIEQLKQNRIVLEVLCGAVPNNPSKQRHLLQRGP